MTALFLAAALAAQPATLSVSLSPRERVVWERGALPELLALPRPGEGWQELARRLAGDPGKGQALRLANRHLARPLRDVRVRVPWTVLAPELRLAVVRELFPHDRRTDEGWVHQVADPWGTGPLTWLEVAELLAGDAGRYRDLQAANPSLGAFPPPGSLLLVPERLLARELAAAAPQVTVAGAATPPPQRVAASRPAAEAVITAPTAAPPATPSSTPAPAAARAPSAAAGSLTTDPSPEELVAEAVGRGAGGGELQYQGDEAIYRLKAGEALYSAVVVRFTGRLEAADVNALAERIAQRSGIPDVTDIAIGFPVRIPVDLLLPEHLPAGHPRRVEWERDQREMGAVRREIRAGNLSGIHIVLDAGHGGADTGAIAAGVWEATYTYDVMARVKRVLERETRATVWAVVSDPTSPAPAEADVLPQHRRHRVLSRPPFSLADSETGLHLRWIVGNAVLARLEKQKVSPERVAFVSIHADSLHPAVRGLMVYVPGRQYRSRVGPRPTAIHDGRDAREAGQPRFTPAFSARAEALSTQLGAAIVRAARRSEIAVHPFKPVRGSVIRGGRRWIPAVLKYSRVPSAVLVEIGNLQNSEDRALLLTWRHREKLAHAIAAGLAEGFSR